MQGVLIKLLENRVLLGRLAVLSTVIPVLLATVDMLFYPMLVSAVILFLTLNWYTIMQWKNNFIEAHYWLKIQYFWFGIAVIVTTWLVSANIRFGIHPAYVVGLIFLAINIIWFNKINTMMTQEGRRIILKGYTAEQKRTLDFEPYLIPLVLSLMIVFLIASIQSMVITRGIKILTIEVIHWTFPVIMILIYFIIDLVFIEQIEWEASDGKTTWKSFEFDLILPSVDNPNEMANYFLQASRLPAPPEGVEEFITNNLQLLVERAQRLDYFPFQQHYIQAMENWGKEGRDHVHLLLAIVLSSISQYRFIGLIPIYKRKMFYQCLGVLAMTGSMTQRWRELIQFEVLEKKDEHYVLDWVLGSRYLKRKYHPDWLISWEGIIYKGKVGYYEAVEKMEYMIHIRPQMEQWGLDIWELSLDYVKVFIGEDARKIMSTNVQFYNQLQYLSAKKTKEEYLQDKQNYQQKLLHSEKRLVYSTRNTHDRELNKNEQREMIRSYLDSEVQSYQPTSFVDTIGLLLREIEESIRNLDRKVIIKLIGLLVIIAANLFGIYLINFMWGQSIATFAIAIEIGILFFFSIAPTDSDLKLDDNRQVQKAVLRTSTFKQSSINVSSADLNMSIFFITYGIILFIMSRLLFF